MKIIIGCLLGLALYNSIELIVMILVTFNKYNGLYFWSLIVSTVGVVVYALGFLIKYFHLLDPNTNICFVAVTMVIVGWYMMVTGQCTQLHFELTPNKRQIRSICCSMVSPPPSYKFASCSSVCDGYDMR